MVLQLDKYGKHVYQSEMVIKQESSSMNKRQIKKINLKVIYPLVDEFNLTTLNEEEQDYKHYLL